ncbi:MAG: hypothetical protein V1799_02960 [bacterium]
MPTYIILTKLSSNGLGNLHKHETIGRKWFNEVKAECPKVKWIDY